MVEHATENRSVGGSIPSLATIRLTFGSRSEPKVRSWHAIPFLVGSRSEPKVRSCRARRRCYAVKVNDRARLEQYIAETTAEIAAMKAIVVNGVATLRANVQSSHTVNTAFRRVIELGPQLLRAQARLAAVDASGASRLTLRRHGYGYTVEGLPDSCAAQLTPEGDRWILIVKLEDERLASYRFMTPFDALAALQSEIDPTMCLVCETVTPRPRH